MESFHHHRNHQQHCNIPHSEKQNHRYYHEQHHHHHHHRQGDHENKKLFPDSELSWDNRSLWIYEHNRVTTEGRELEEAALRRKKQKQLRSRTSWSPERCQGSVVAQIRVSQQHSPPQLHMHGRTQSLPTSRPIFQPTYFTRGSHRSLSLSHSPVNSDKDLTITFRVNFQTNFGEKIHLVGNTMKLGMWNPFNAPAMRWTAGNNWILPVTLPYHAVHQLEYKYVLANGDGLPLRWEGGKENHRVQLQTNNPQREIGEWYQFDLWHE